ncbi:hypothetical protein OEZ85_008517 [Tetradesmus obliquus]|uniref:RRM domain-containing protein n=1 Tax=Tetradesmus obliquus TaxID=3088 RepID=A0ABY8TJC6_TETOB|nr:hypothetical protein OEZ85_008517 [Tetradesmus obliquus]
MAHSYSGDSLEDLEAMRLSSASFAAALEEAEAIAANVEASIARRQQKQQDAAAAAAAAAAQEAGAQPTTDRPTPADALAGEDAHSCPTTSFAPADNTSLEGAATLDAPSPSPSPTPSDSSNEYDPAELTRGQPSRHLWLGNLHQRLPRSVLRGVFERYGPVDDVVTFPGRMYAFVNFKEAGDAAKAAEAVQDKEVPLITGPRRLVVKFRPSRRALGKGPAAAAAAGSSDAAGGDDCDIPEGRPSRHLWLGNIPLKPNRTAMEALFSRFGPLESVRVFPGKTFAFVNFVAAGHAIQAKAALDGQPSPHITGPKPLVIRFQKDTAGVPPAGTVAKVGVDIASARARKGAVPRTSLTGLLGPSPGAAGGGGSLGGLGEDELAAAEPAVNLSNKLNPNNIHFDRELAARYKRMSKAEKEALWAHDRALQQLEHNPAAAATLFSAAAAAAASAAAAGQRAPGTLFEQQLQHPGGGNAAAAAAAASSIYGQLMSAANPQLAAAAALAQAQARGASAAGLYQQMPAAASLQSAWGSAAAANPYQAAAAAAALNAQGLGAAAGLGQQGAAAAAANRQLDLLAQLGGYGGAAGQMAGGAAGLQQYLAAAAAAGGGGLHAALLGQANPALLQQMASSYSMPMHGQQDAHMAAAAAAALQLSGGP